MYKIYRNLHRLKRSDHREDGKSMKPMTKREPHHHLHTQLGVCTTKKLSYLQTRKECLLKLLHRASVSLKMRLPRTNGERKRHARKQLHWSCSPKRLLDRFLQVPGLHSRHVRCNLNFAEVLTDIGAFPRPGLQVGPLQSRLEEISLIWFEKMVHKTLNQLSDKLATYFSSLTASCIFLWFRIFKCVLV